MPTFGLPGAAITEKSARRTGVLALAAVAAVAAVWTGVQSVRVDDRMRVTLRTEQIGDGIVTGARVRLDGVNVGEVTDIDSAGAGQQEITLRLDKSQLTGLTDALVLDYAPSNLFGISEVELRRGEGGAALRDGASVDLTGGSASRVTNATLGTLIRSLGQTTDQVLTPQLADVLTTLATDAKAFTPILEAVVMLGRAVAETQRYDPSFLIGQYASTLHGTAAFAGATVDLLDHINNIEVLRTDQPLFDSGVALLAEQMFPSITNLGQTGQRHYTGYTDMLTPLLNVTAQMVPTPQRSSAELRTLLERIDNAFVDSPEGPVLRLELTLRGFPALAAPLFGTVAPVAAIPAPAAAGGSR
ncbi:MlaD protein [Nocardia amikacinitolerans]|uniref:MlaD family protein n=1 Tax=Nocardia amikacinitolerans TaxID=756689 RepID=UPI000834646E|nr:MlaD family protein [Nocardia amikacinitolerans]MCP2315994.1 MlaD protein [Nocardia amikacinitolerans]